MPTMISAIADELILQKNYLDGKLVNTIYFGGGTPSLLNQDQLQLLIQIIRDEFNLAAEVEVTLEANPDDLTEEKLASFLELGINRISIGVQSFDDNFLKFMNRAHCGDEAIKSIKNARKLGFKNISIDLIYGVPFQDHTIWNRDLDTALGFDLPHISSYCLTIEKETVFGKWVKQGRIQPINEEFSAIQFEMLIDVLTKNGYEHYEISNFCFPHHYSKHNSNYWRQETYLGVGPSAHSYNLNSRHYNCKNNHKYMTLIQGGEIPCIVENLTLKDKINEYLLTSLRTQWGCDLTKLRKNYGVDLIADQKNYVEKICHNGLAVVEEDTLKLTLSGKLVADKIITDLFVV